MFSVATKCCIVNRPRNELLERLSVGLVKIVSIWLMLLVCLSSAVTRKQGKLQKRGKINLIGRLQLTTEKTRDEDNEGIVQLRILRTQVRETWASMATTWFL